MSDLGVHEYTALRATIQQRGTARVVVFLAAVIAWAVLVVIVRGTRTPVLALVPLAVLAAGFEAVAALHLGVERLGRYLQVFYETAPSPAWERAAMAYGRRFPGGPDPLYALIFVVAALLNFIPILAVQVVLTEFLALAVPHLMFIVRVFVVRGQAARQREIDLRRFEELKHSLSAS